jgi:hypothetical protein
VALLLQQPLVVVLVMPLVVQAVARAFSVVSATVPRVKVTAVVQVDQVTGHVQEQQAVGVVAVAVALARRESPPTWQTTAGRVTVASAWRVHFSPPVLQQLWVLATS